MKPKPKFKKGEIRELGAMGIPLLFFGDKVEILEVHQENKRGGYEIRYKIKGSKGNVAWVYEWGLV